MHMSNLNWIWPAQISLWSILLLLLQRKSVQDVLQCSIFASLILHLSFSFLGAILLDDCDLIYGSQLKKFLPTYRTFHADHAEKFSHFISPNWNRTKKRETQQSHKVFASHIWLNFDQTKNMGIEKKNWRFSENDSFAVIKIQHPENLKEEVSAKDRVG